MKSQAPPVFARKLLRWLMADDIYHDVEGDLRELYQDRLEAIGAGRARWHYYKDVLFSARNSTLRRKLKIYNPTVMYKNYLKIAFRNLLKYKSYSFINIFGLALGMAACLLILLFVNNELSFDGFHEKKSNIYRLDEVQTFGAVSAQKVALSMYPMGPNMMADYPEITNFTRFWTMGSKTLVQREDQQHYLEQVVRVDTSFLQMFDFDLVMGDRETALTAGWNIMLSESAAKRIFGNENPMGELLRTNDESVQFKVTGVFADVPDQSHLQFDALLSIKPWDEERRRNGWGSNYLNTYLELADNVDVGALEAKFDDFLGRYMEDYALDFYELFLQPLTDVHLGSMDITHDYNNHKKFSRGSVNVFMILALFVLLIASINFMNLSTARAATRAREVGVRKSIGAFKRQITGQFLVESVLLVLISLLIALGICLLAIKPLSQIIDRELSLMLFAEPVNALAILMVALLIGLLSGVYPALFMSGFNPVTALKGSGLKGGKSLFRNVLVIFQYAIAIAIIIGTIVATRQLKYMQNLDLGFEKDLVVTVDMYGDTNEKYDLLRGELVNQPNILDVTATTQRLGNNLHQTTMTYRNDTARVDGSSSFVAVETNFMDFYKMEILEGRALSRDYEDDMRGRSFVVNETLAKELAVGGGDVVGTPFNFGGSDTLGTIVGVVKNFNYNKLSLRVEPLFMSRQPWGWSEINVKLKSGDIAAGLSEIESVWSELFPQRPFEYQFLDEHIGQMYQSEQQLTKVISILSILAIIIASLGLFGLASFTVRQRLKEMGIRKVLGASVGQIVLILSKKFTLLVIIAFAVAAPLTYWLMSGWMAGYEYRVGMGMGIFILVGLASWLIALLTVSAQSLGVAKSNPVKTLRIE